MTDQAPTEEMDPRAIEAAASIRDVGIRNIGTWDGLARIIAAAYADQAVALEQARTALASRCMGHFMFRLTTDARHVSNVDTHVDWCCSLSKQELEATAALEGKENGQQSRLL